MQSVIVLALALCCKSSLQQLTEAPEEDPRITDGSYVEVEKVPYQVFFSMGTKPFCGGAIISPKFILTGAQCTAKIKRLDITLVRAGTSYTNYGGISRKIKKINQHKKYSTKTKDYDYSLVELEYPLIFCKFVSAVKLPAVSESEKHGEKCLLSGWGLTGVPTHEQAYLQTANVKIIKRKKCKKYYKSKITKRMLCAGSKQGGTNACKGDSGGPLVCGGKLVGILSWGFNKCGAAKSSTVYSRVAAVRDWIKKTTGT